MIIVINPSLLSANLCNLEKDIRTLEKNSIKIVHIDVMDGKFVSEIAFGIEQIRAINKITDMEIDVHLMVNNPEKYISALVDSGADCITVHQEACISLYKTVHYIKSYGIKAGVALNPATNITTLNYVMNLLNKVHIMTVEPGFAGQKFIPIMKEKIEKLVTTKYIYQYDFEIQVEGGINLDNISDVVKCCASNIVIGEAIFENGNIDSNIEKFYKAVQIG
ncbi:MAG: ribulose-phosphate 3-epimerase [Clostridiaceae bacterium]